MGFWSKKKKGAEQERAEELPALPPVREDKKRRSPRRKRGIAPLEVKLVAVKAVDAGLLIREVAELADVSTTTVSNWVKAFREEGEGNTNEQEGLSLRAALLGAIH